MCAGQRCHGAIFFFLHASKQGLWLDWSRLSIDFPCCGGFFRLSMRVKKEGNNNAGDGRRVDRTPTCNAIFVLCATSYGKNGSLFFFDFFLLKYDNGRERGYTRSS
nr:hypothetical protein [Pandoravirus massiliensis]